MAATLPAAGFLRVHRSYIVALERVDRRTSGTLRVAGHELPVGRSYRQIEEDRLR